MGKENSESEKGNKREPQNLERHCP